MRKAVIIGAGLSGLAAGITLASRGVQTEVFDLSTSPGGMCRAWYRKDYRFDGCIQWMTGIRPDDPVYALYRETEALAENTAIYTPCAQELELDGALLQIPLELSEFRGFLVSLSTADMPAIEALCSDIEVIVRAKRPPGPETGCRGILERLMSGRGCQALWRRTAGRTVGEYAAGFKAPAIGKILTRLAPAEYSLYALITALGSRMSGNAGYPLGGADGVVRRMTERFKALGGSLRLGARADEIIVSSGKAQGVRAGGAVWPADGVIAACDAYNALVTLLGGRYRHRELALLLRNGPMYEPMAAVSFGLCRRFDIPYALTCECPEGIGVAPGVKRYGFALRSFDFDPAAAPAGCSSVMAGLHVPLEYWKSLRDMNPTSYRLQKELLADQLAAKIEKRYPGFRDAIEIVDVATPATYDRLTNAYKGSLEGFAPTPQVLKTHVKRTLPGLKRFYLCSQWTASVGGIGAAIAGGREAARRLLRELR